ncbi:uncharacterized protein LOC126845500 [Adelges cooleyi]|uniref:uncharacterized protein LOC126845500 n=1 Tax=Adelges cooleyi TaxID=133065 RepID=UPI00217F4BA4|nr:uncharacterized protein LOC126845500 [Adelges cooleyi]
MYLKFIIFLIVSVFIVNPVVGPPNEDTQLLMNQTLDRVYLRILQHINAQHTNAVQYLITLSQFLDYVGYLTNTRDTALLVAQQRFGVNVPYSKIINQNDFNELIIEICRRLPTSVQAYTCLIEQAIV